MDDLSMDLVLFGQTLCLLDKTNMPVYMIFKNYYGGIWCWPLYLGSVAFSIQKLWPFAKELLKLPLFAVGCWHLVGEAPSENKVPFYVPLN